MNCIEYSEKSAKYLILRKENKSSMDYLITEITVMKSNGFGGIPALKILNLANNILTGMDTKVFEGDHYVDILLK